MLSFFVPDSGTFYFSRPPADMTTSFIGGILFWKLPVFTSSLYCEVYCLWYIELLGKFCSPYALGSDGCKNAFIQGTASSIHIKLWQICVVKKKLTELIGKITYDGTDINILCFVFLSIQP